MASGMRRLRMREWRHLNRSSNVITLENLPLYLFCVRPYGVISTALIDFLVLLMSEKIDIRRRMSSSDFSVA